MDKFVMLKQLGAGDFQHLNGTLEAHLKGTQRILKSWGSSELLQVAGLFHAAYGTAGFEEHMVSLDQRSQISTIIGQAEEELVYLYCACDRDFVWPQFGKTSQIQFKDRFTGTIFQLNEAKCRLLCELTVANELELVHSSEEFKIQYGAQLLALFQTIDSYLSSNARSDYQSALLEFAN